MIPPSCRSRERRAGTAYIEAIAVASLMALLLACALRFERASRARLGTERGLRTTAWTQALRGCARTDRELLGAARALVGLPPTAAGSRLQQAMTSRPDRLAHADRKQSVCNEPLPAAAWASPSDIDHFLAGVLADGEGL